MGLNETPGGSRIQIGFFGRRNAGKSSLINALTGQQTAIVSPVKGTTTDPVYKAMEILPLGPCMLIDTPGLDDEGELGAKRVEKTEEVLRRTDLALLVVDGSKWDEIESLESSGVSELSDSYRDALAFVQKIEARGLPYILVINYSDKLSVDQKRSIADLLQQRKPEMRFCFTAAGENVFQEKTDGTTLPEEIGEIVEPEKTDGIGFSEKKEASGIEQLKKLLMELAPKASAVPLVGDLVLAQDMVVLVTPIDESAPKGRLILPQQQVIRDLLDHHAVPVVTQVSELSGVLAGLQGQVKLVITDSQAFEEVNRIVPEEIALTSFSILFARYKGNLAGLAGGMQVLEHLEDGDRILIAEGCTHHRQCGDIGTVKIPRWLREHSGADFVIETCSGKDFPKDLTSYKAVIHCGGCTFPEKEMKYRMSEAKRLGVPMLNYGMVIAYLKGIFQRSTALFPEIGGRAL